MGRGAEMPEYEGYVSKTDGEGRADVFIFPGRSFIPNAEHLDVCHCATFNSSFSVRALNTAGARVGDLVAVRLEGRILAGNIAIILGAPALGVALALFTVLSLPSITHPWIWTASGLLGGGLAGIALSIKRGRAREPLIERVITRAQDAQCKIAREKSGCAGCNLSHAKGIEL
jgi:hypothetical protein